MAENELPAGWLEAPLSQCGWLFRGQGGTKEDEDPGGLPCIRYGDLYTHHGCIVRSFASWISAKRVSSYTALQAGDVVFAGSGETFEEIGKAAAYCDDAPAYAGADTIILRPGPILDPRFAGYAVNSETAIHHKSRMGQGSSVKHIGVEHLSRMPLRAPPIEQQQRIAEILFTIDEAIFHTEALIAKTKQLKTGLMHDLFTRGVMSDGRLRPPPEEAPNFYFETSAGWLPKEWELKRLGMVAEIVSGVTLGGANGGQYEVPYLRVANVQDGFLDLHDVKSIRVSLQILQKLQLRPGDVLMNEGGDFDKLGRGTVWNDEISPCIHQNHVFRVRPQLDALRSHFLNYWSQSNFGRKYFITSSKQSTNLASINSTQLNAFPVPCPELSEQERVETRLQAVDVQIGSLNSNAQMLRNMKHGLMHDLLTGRVRVPLAVDQAEADR